MKNRDIEQVIHDHDHDDDKTYNKNIPLQYRLFMLKDHNKLNDIFVEYVSGTAFYCYQTIMRGLNLLTNCWQYGRF
ncbi:hypothetical protein HDU92_008426 [Lobulomyces angularis]|nr:hypothetical protein HDU92_008426 [Lobulomyces angularis]